MNQPVPLPRVKMTITLRQDVIDALHLIALVDGVTVTEALRRLISDEHNRRNPS